PFGNQIRAISRAPGRVPLFQGSDRNRDRCPSGAPARVLGKAFAHFAVFIRREGRLDGAMERLGPPAIGVVPPVVPLQRFDGGRSLSLSNLGFVRGYLFTDAKPC